MSGKKDKSRGIGGEVDVVNTQMTIQIQKGHEDYRFQIPVQVVLGESGIPVLLGRKGFFDKFKIIFEQNKQRVSLKKITKSL